VPLKLFGKVIGADVSNARDFTFVGLNLIARLSQEDVAELILRTCVTKSRLVAKPVDILELGFKVEFVK
jgi:hypothetical protein